MAAVATLGPKVYLYLALTPSSNKSEKQSGKGRNSMWDLNCAGQEQEAGGS